MTALEKVSFVTACNRFFGRKPGQTTGEFAVELRALTEKDKADLIAMFPSVGFEIV